VCFGDRGSHCGRVNTYTHRQTRRERRGEATKRTLRSCLEVLELREHGLAQHVDGGGRSLHGGLGGGQLLCARMRMIRMDGWTDGWMRMDG
jgi:hypothetical protein